MNQAKNVKEFKALIARYESITLDEIEEAADKWSTGEIMKGELTGFGSTALCTLCQPTREVPGMDVDCRNCVYPCDDNYTGGCVKHWTYDAIADANLYIDLLSAYRARARYMRGVLKRYNAKLKKDKQ